MFKLSGMIKKQTNQFWEHHPKFSLKLRKVLEMYRFSLPKCPFGHVEIGFEKFLSNIVLTELKGRLLALKCTYVFLKFLAISFLSHLWPIHCRWKISMRCCASYYFPSFFNMGRKSSSRRVHYQSVLYKTMPVKSFFKTFCRTTNRLTSNWSIFCTVVVFFLQIAVFDATNCTIPIKTIRIE